MKKKQVTKADIMAISAGQSVEWTLPTPRAARNAQAMVNYVKTFCEVDGVKDYKTQRIGNTIKIEAL